MKKTHIHVFTIMEYLQWKLTYIQSIFETHEIQDNHNIVTQMKTFWKQKESLPKSPISSILNKTILENKLNLVLS